MKKQLFIIVLGVLISSLSAVAQETASKSSYQEVAKKVDVYYFHGDRRCVTCKAVGSVTKAYLTEKYTKEMEAEIVHFHDVNYDMDENKKLAEEMQIAGSSLLVVKTQGSLIETENMTNLAFMYAIANPQKLKEALKKEIDNGI